MKRKLSIITISYIIGLLWGLYFNKNMALFICVLPITYCIAKKKFYTMFIIFNIILSCFLANSKRQKYDNLYNDMDECLIVGTIIKEPSYDKNIKKYTIKVDSVNGENKFKNSKIIVYEKNNSSIVNTKYGNLVKFSGSFKIANKSRNYKGYNYNEYLRSNNIYGIAQTESSSIYICKNNNVGWYNKFINSGYNYIRHAIYEVLPSKTAELYTAIILGDKGGLDEGVINDFSESNLSHILAVSGMHLSYIVSIVSVILSMSGKKIKSIVTICTVILFCNISGNSYSVVRASIMIIIYVCGGLLHRKSDSLTNISIAALLELIANPYAIKSLSFIFSFAATLSIIEFNNFVNNRLPQRWDKNIIGKYVKNSISLSISANVIILPITAMYFNKVSLNFLISNLLSTFLLSLIMPLGFICILMYFYSPLITEILAKLLNVLLICLIKISKIRLISLYLTSQQVCIFVGVTLSLIAFVFLKKSRKIFKYLVVIFLSVIIVIRLFRMANTNMYIFFVDVGQGDCTLIKTPKGKKVLIDGGGKEDSEYIGKEILVPYLLNRDIKNIDYIIISHFDTDHVGGILTVMEKLKVKKVVISKQYENSENYDRLKRIAREKRINILVVNKGDKLYIEKNVYFDVIWPDNDNVISENVLNNNSIVCTLHYNNFSLLFTGDIEEIAEKQILQEYKERENLIKSKAIKVAHHGSKTSSTTEFLETVKPCIALIGVGENNKFGHPSEEVVKRLNFIRM